MCNYNNSVWQKRKVHSSFILHKDVPLRCYTKSSCSLHTYPSWCDHMWLKTFIWGNAVSQQLQSEWLFAFEPQMEITMIVRKTAYAGHFRHNQQTPGKVQNKNNKYFNQKEWLPILQLWRTRWREEPRDIRCKEQTLHILNASTHISSGWTHIQTNNIKLQPKTTCYIIYIVEEASECGYNTVTG